jgi:hypothetical protein
MRKIPTVFVRDEKDRRYVTEAVTPGCEWVLAGEGQATRKYDGTCVMLDEDGAWWARREVKPGKTPPPNYVPIETDNTTGKTVGWEPVAQSAFAKFHAEALGGPSSPPTRPGTYELVGPKINGNPERVGYHILRCHEFAERLPTVVRSYESLRRVVLALNEGMGCEGIVWHHEDGRMAKLKARDFSQASDRQEPTS